jgi:leucyl/phenylalanyl-tRNA---protein transferase
MPVRGLLLAYRLGWFPMAEPETGRLHWFWPDPRAILPLDGGFHIPRSLRQRVRSGRFTITSDLAFEAVIRRCARPGDETSWIDDRLLKTYIELHRAGHAHSVEAWVDGSDEATPRRSDGGKGRENEPRSGRHGTMTLVGGLYGVHIGGLFTGESMFSLPQLGGTNASKVCLVHLVEHMRRRGMTLLDVQFQTPHLARFGCRTIRRREYLLRLAAATALDIPWGPFRQTPAPGRPGAGGSENGPSSP